MDWIQLHLALNHVPVIGTPILVLLLAIGWFRKSNEVIRLVLWSIVALAVVAIAIKFTGDFAAEQSPDQFVDAKEYVSRHEQAGDQATTGVFLLGIAAAVSLFFARKRKTVQNGSILLVLLLGIATCVLYARSAHTGGEISHPELRK